MSDSGLTCTGHGAGDPSAAEIKGFFASSAAKASLVASDSGVSLRIAGSSPRPWPQVAAAARFRGRSDHRILRCTGGSGKAGSICHFCISPCFTVFGGSQKNPDAGKHSSKSAIVTSLFACPNPSNLGLESSVPICELLADKAQEKRQIDCILRKRRICRLAQAHGGHVHHRMASFMSCTWRSLLT